MQQRTDSSRRRGRRAGGADTREALLAAAREEFAEHGFAQATVRRIAARADLDPAMINHWFGGKQNLFTEAVLRLPFHPGDVAATVFAEPVDRWGEHMVRELLRVWDTAGGESLRALLRSVSSSTLARDGFRDMLVEQAFAPLTARLGVPDARLRATLCASQILGLVSIRYLFAMEPLASADTETMVAAVAPNLQRYLTGPLD